MRAIVTGGRDLTDPAPVVAALRDLADRHAALTVVHGGCPTGADNFASQWCRTEGAHHPTCQISEECHPADWSRHGRAAGPIRNQQMVDLGADLVLAFPIGASRGTRHCIRTAVAAGIPVKEWRPVAG